MVGQLTEEQWSALQKEFAVRLSPESREKLLRYLALLDKWRQRLSLTSLEQEDEILRYHFFESFWAAEHFLNKTNRLVDIGSGAGFPGLAIALYRPNLEITLIESNRKKAVFLEEVARQLRLSAHVACCRAKDFGAWQNFDLGALRAVRFSPKLQQVLAETPIDLLWFHGGSESFPPGWKALKSQRVPGSRSRFVSHLTPHL